MPAGEAATALLLTACPRRLSQENLLRLLAFRSFVSVLISASEAGFSPWRSTGFLRYGTS
jgi:hypothetical protein